MLRIDRTGLICRQQLMHTLALALPKSRTATCHGHILLSYHNFSRMALSTILDQIEISQHVWDGLPWNFVWIFPSGWITNILLTLVIRLIFPVDPSQVKFIIYSVKSTERIGLKLLKDILEPLRMNYNTFGDPLFLSCHYELNILNRPMT